MNHLSGRPVLRRYLNQKAMNLVSMWPLETQWAVEELTQVCCLLEVQLVSDGFAIYLEPISLTR
jgi:hypothetical protein